MPVPAWFAEILLRELKARITLADDKIAQLYQHFDLLGRWNRRMNLTAMEPGPEMVTRHYCESLFFAAHLRNEPSSIADIGSGAGFPGVPMAILRPEWRVTLVESNQRKAVFLREATRSLSNVMVVSGRAESVSGTFDWLVSRAVALKEVLTLIPQLASRIALMIGKDDISLLESAKHIAWSEAIRLPWGDHRVCLFGEYVSRGTG